MLRADRVEGASDLVELPLRQRATKAVVDDLKILLGDLRSFFDPDVRQLPSLEGDGLQLLPLALIVDAPEDDLIPVDQAFQGQRRGVDLPVAPVAVTEHPVDRAGQLRIGAVAVGDVRLADAHQVPARILHQPQDIMLGSVHALARAG